MHRLFVALRPPPAMRADLLALMGGVPGARWQDEEQLHLTLRFIGEVERPQADDIAAALGAVTQPRPTITLAGVGTFDSKGRPHTLWAAVAPDEALRALRERITRALATVGVMPEERAFKPHITLARLGRWRGRSIHSWRALPVWRVRPARWMHSCSTKVSSAARARAIKPSPATR